MANLQETTEFTPGIYQLEEEDLVKGGADGIDNLQAKQLAARTRWLKLQVEAALGEMAAHLAAADPHTQYATEVWVAAQITGLINAAPGALDTLNELAAAMGNDPNFAATVTNALALKAPLASPAFTGNPTAPTPAQFDADLSLATTEFVKRASGSYRGYSQAPNVISVVDIGMMYQPLEGSTVEFPKPSALSIPSGAAVGIAMSGRTAARLIATGGGSFFIDGPITTTLDLVTGQSITLVAAGEGWVVTGHLKGDQLFASSLSTSGYQKLPSGLIIQWGNASTDATGKSVDNLFPIAFPNTCFAITALYRGAGIAAPLLGCQALVQDRAKFTAYIASISNGGVVVGAFSNSGFSWIALGN